MTRSTAQSSSNSRIIPLAVVLALVYWIFESLIDSRLFHSSPFFQEILFPRPDELWMRIIIIGLILALSVYAHIMVVRHKRLEQLCRSGEQTQQSLLNATTEAALLLSLDGTIQALNERAAEDLETNVSDAVGKDIFDLIPPEAAARLRTRQQTVIETGQALRMEDHQDGRWFDISVYPVPDGNGRVVQCALFAREITEGKRMEQELIRLSITDDLTGLFNQRQFAERVEPEVDRAKRMKYPLCLVILDVDDFKVYNDTYGHLKGNEILSGIGEIIRHCIRKDVDSAYRFGGDEFALILPYADKETALEIIRRIDELIIGDLKGVTISFGIAPLTHGTTARELVHAADISMYENKGRTRTILTMGNGRG